MKISAVCFDLGKVLLHFDWKPMLDRVAKKSPLPPEKIAQLLKEDPQVLVYEAGGITSAKFFAHLKKLLKYKGTTKELRAAFVEIFTPLPEHIALAGLTVFLSWSFMQTMFALHYAHEYYMEKDGTLAEGLEFPGQNHQPDYWDFVYYAFVIGTSTATADVNIVSSVMRRITTLHCVVAFFFNTTILALTVNIGAGLF